MKLNKRTELPEDAVVLDTETTGFEPSDGHRIIEIGAHRIRDGIRTGDSLHILINPERSVPKESTDVHGLTNEILADKPVFAEIAQAFVDFLGDDPMIAHNAAFDLRFLNFELTRAGFAAIPNEKVFDSIKAARRLYPGASANLDALCRRFNISLAGREKHGALIDTELLTDVLVEMGGGRQTSLLDSFEIQSRGGEDADAIAATVKPVNVIRASLRPEELERHAALVEKLGEASPWHNIPVAEVMHDGN